MDAPIKVSFPYGKHTVTFETGRIARQASAAVLVDMDGTTVLVTVVGVQSDDADERSFFPLTVNYQERTYAAGKIPGGYFRREGRPSEKETLTSRLIDRPLRPLFPEGFKNEVQVVATVVSLNPDIDPDIPDEIEAAFGHIEKRIVRERILNKKPRIDGRDTTTVRPITVEVGVLSRVHGSALFTRGETQALVVTTLGSARDAQSIDALEGNYSEPFMLHYNFPPYSVGETGMVGSPKRREIGHGRLAKRGVQAIMPSQEEFPYSIRVVSEITESNGSSSMASVCGSCLSMMDAGVPIKAAVAGIAMGLVKEGDRYAVLSDILGDEDHLGDMDFKVTGTAKGVTALQMDIKIQGITREIMDVALAQARDGRLHILEIMNQVIAEPRSDVSEFAPRITTFQINPDKIRDVIGKGGATIRSITESTGVTIDITDEGMVRISAVDGNAANEAQRQIELLTTELEIGKVYPGKVTKIMDFGAFVNVLPGKDGLVHVSQISSERIEDVTSVLSEGQEVTVKVLEIDRQGKVRLSMKDI